MTTNKEPETAVFCDQVYDWLAGKSAYSKAELEQPVHNFKLASEKRGTDE